LNGKLTDEVYMRQPEGFVIEGQENLVCKLKRSIYGLKQSPRCWNHTIDSQLKSMGFEQSTSDPCLYVASAGEMFVIAVYIDDIVLGSRNDKKMLDVKITLSQCFEMKDLGMLHHFLGVEVFNNTSTGKIWVGQPLYTERVLERFGMEFSKPTSTPASPDTKLQKKAADGVMVSQKLYQAAVGTLLYLSTKTRPDIAFAVSNVARFCAEPTEEHWSAVKRIFRYLRGTKNMGLLYDRDKSKALVGYSDADWAGSLDDRRSTSGYVFLSGGAAISWRSQKQTCIALSTAEAEYVALSSATQEALWLQQLVNDVCGTASVISILEDNQSAICLANNPQFHGKMKHVEIKYHFVRDQVEKKKIKLVYCRSEDMLADVFTKDLPIQQFQKLRKMIGVSKLTK